MKDQCAWQLEQGQELSILKEKINVTQETGVANCALDGQMAMGLASLDGCVKLFREAGEVLAGSAGTRQQCMAQSLGAEGVLPSRQIESFWRVFKQFTHNLPSRQVVSYLSICPPL